MKYVFTATMGETEKPIVLTDRKTLRFGPSTGKVLALRHVNLPRQVYKFGKRIRIPYGKCSPQRELRFLEEGVCLWNEKTETYRLIYPFDSIRSIFNECKQETTTQYEL